MQEIKMVDLYGQYLRIKPTVDAAMRSVIESSQFIQGPAVQEFAKALAEYNQVEHVIPCGNGTDALQIALMALDLHPGDEVILPVHTYVATAEVVALLRLTPVFIDVDERTFNIDVNQLERSITPRTKVIVPVHLYGQCADMESILSVAQKHNLFVVEDAAQSIGAEYTFSNGTKMKAGTMGNIGCTSFFPSKNLGCFGDGGAIFTRDAILAEKMKMIANHGQQKKYTHDCIGVNSRLDSIQAAVLTVKLAHLNAYNATRNDVASFYENAFKNQDKVEIPTRAPYSTHVFNQYTIKVQPSDRDKLKSHLADKGIPTMIYYPIPLHLQKAYRTNDFGEGSFPVTEKLSKSVISLPIHTELTPAQLEYISSAVTSYFAS